MRIGMAAIAAGVMIAAAGCGGSAEKDAALQRAWDSFGTGTQSLFCKAAIQDGENFYGPALSVAERAGNGATQYDAQQFILATCPESWLMLD